MSILPMKGVPVDSEMSRFFERHPLLADPSTTAAVDVARYAQHRRYSRRQTLWQPGEPATSVMFLRSGVVRESQLTTSDRELTLHLHGRKALFGTEAIGTDAVRHTRAIAHEDVSAYVLSRESFLHVLASHPGVAIGLVQTLDERRVRLDGRLASVAYLTARARVANVLLELAESFGVHDSRGTIVNVRLTHREMAALIGATRETVSFAILAFRRTGLIETEQKRVVLLDVDRLRAEAVEAVSAES